MSARWRVYEDLSGMWLYQARSLRSKAVHIANSGAGSICVSSVQRPASKPVCQTQVGPLGPLFFSVRARGGGLRGACNGKMYLLNGINDIIYKFKLILKT